MSVSFTWKIYNQHKLKPRLNGGTSSDIDIFKQVFPERLVSDTDLSKLRAMHAMTKCQASLWSELADKIESLQDDTATPVILEIDWEF